VHPNQNADPGFDAWENRIERKVLDMRSSCIVIAVWLSTSLYAATTLELRLRAENPATAKSSWIPDGIVLYKAATEDTSDTPSAVALLTYLTRMKLHPTTDTQWSVIRARLAQVALKPDGSWNDRQVDCCLEYGRLIAPEDTARATAVLDRLGQSAEPLYRILAGEAAGDVHLALKKYKQDGVILKHREDIDRVRAEGAEMLLRQAVKAFPSAPAPAARGH